MPFKEVESWERQKKEEYYLKIREECLARNRKENGWNAFIKTLALFLRHFEIEIRGEEKIPDSTECIFVGNHSNSHDLFVVKEAMSIMNRRVTPLAAWDGLNFISRIIFYMANITFIKRSDKCSIENGILNFCSKILNGDNGFVMGEATWNSLLEY